MPMERAASLSLSFPLSLLALGAEFGAREKSTATGRAASRGCKGKPSATPLKRGGRHPREEGSANTGIGSRVRETELRVSVRAESARDATPSPPRRVLLLLLRRCPPSPPPPRPRSSRAAAWWGRRFALRALRASPRRAIHFCPLTPFPRPPLRRSSRTRHRPGTRSTGHDRAGNP